LLVIDDFAIYSLNRDEASNLYGVIIKRHKLKSSILRRIKLFKEWQELFSDPIHDNSVLDRLAQSSY
jgi:DNA replication protein DnaC